MQLKLWEAFLLALLPIIGTYIGAHISWKAAREKIDADTRLEREKRLLEKYEEIDRLLGDVWGKAASLSTQVVLNVGHHVQFDAAKVTAIPIDRLEVLVHFYAAELTDDVKAISDLNLKLSKATVQAVANAMFESQRFDRGEIALAASSAPIQMQAHVESARAKLVRLVRELLRGPESAADNVRWSLSNIQWLRKFFGREPPPA